MEYFSYIGIVSFFAFFQPILKKNNLIISTYFCVTLITALLIGLRGSNDEYSRFYIYVPDIYELIKNGHYHLYEAPLFTIISSLLQSLHLNSQFILLIFALGSVSITAFYFQKFSKYYFIAFVIYLVNFVSINELAQVKQGFASALYLVIIYKLCENKKFSLMSYFFSSMAHFVALISFVSIYLTKLYRLKTYLFLILAALFIYAFDIFGYFYLFIINLPYVPHKIAVYQDSIYNYDQGLLRFKILNVLVVISLFLFIIYKNGNNLQLKYFPILFNSYFLGALILISLSTSAVFANRLSIFFFIVEPILISYLLYFTQYKKIVTMVLLLGALSIAYYNYVIQIDVWPYNFLLDKNLYEEIIIQKEIDYIR